MITVDELKTLAVELQELIQGKVGTTKFAEVYSRIRQNAVAVRRERKTARAVQACHLVDRHCLCLTIVLHRSLRTLHWR